MSAHITLLDAEKWLVEIDAPNSGKGFFCLTRSDAIDAKEMLNALTRKLAEVEEQRDRAKLFAETNHNAWVLMNEAFCGKESQLATLRRAVDSKAIYSEKDGAGERHYFCWLCDGGSLDKSDCHEDDCPLNQAALATEQAEHSGDANEKVAGKDAIDTTLDQFAAGGHVWDGVDPRELRGEVAVQSAVATFPNPLHLNFGHGRLKVGTFSNAAGSVGVVIIKSDVSGKIGEPTGDSEEPNWIPEPGEIYLHFANADSAQLLIETIQKAIAEHPAPASDGKGAELTDAELIDYARRKGLTIMANRGALQPLSREHLLECWNEDAPHASAKGGG